jgi:hypothetical protein
MVLVAVILATLNIGAAFVGIIIGVSALIGTVITFAVFINPSVTSTVRYIFYRNMFYFATIAIGLVWMLIGFELVFTLYIKSPMNPIIVWATSLLTFFCVIVDAYSSG